MKTLKALKHWIKGYRLHPKEARRLEDLWNNIKVGIITILLISLIIWLLSGMGVFETKVGF
jgi:hypothetical protein